jgi:hypothetical protein
VYEELSTYEEFLFLKGIRKNERKINRARVAKPGLKPGSFDCRSTVFMYITDITGKWTKGEVKDTEMQIHILY